MKDRRNPDGFAYLGQPWPAEDPGRLGCEKTGLGAGNGIAACGEYDHIMLDEFLDDGDMPLVQRGAGVVSPNHAADTSYAAVDDVIV